MSDLETREPPAAPGARVAAEFDWRRVQLRSFVPVFLWAVALLVALWFWAPVMRVGLLFIGACACAAALAPVARAAPIRSKRLSGALVGIGFVALVIGTLAGLVFLVAEKIRSELEQWPEVRDTIDGALASWSRSLGFEEPVTTAAVMESARGWVLDGGMGSALGDAVGWATGLIVGVALLAFGTIYLLSQKPGRLTDPLARLLPAPRDAQMRRAVSKLEPRLRWWFIGVLASMTITGVATWIGFEIVGVKFAITLAFVAALSQVAPTIGPAIAFLIALVVAATQGTTVIIGVAVVWMVVQLIESYVLLPMIMYRAVHIPPVVTLFTIVLWAGLIGPLGLLFAIPLDLVLWTGVEEFVE
ncbi:MAG: AI-2E family transporter [Phycisphaerales bacterium]